MLRELTVRNIALIDSFASDTCLPAIIRTSGERNTILGIFSGMVLTVAVPLFVTAIFAWM